ncbi:uncharacterized protein CIMG_02842 [Coccidioides immitis RS]|uniref:Uncharacterized protein n=1 Tax=Coccidioides immitis (strain RS) TaxID=246410 RepID=J3KM82_COCIM|nr:uncharacterized protein CIMG_02842 [Coccidioides immitis RS]EAS37488.3 hypothetical protein CIMG_02842 [Coccidioides immitis RS]
MASNPGATQLVIRRDNPGTPQVLDFGTRLSGPGVRPSADWAFTERPALAEEANASRINTKHRLEKCDCACWAVKPSTTRVENRSMSPDRQGGNAKFSCKCKGCSSPIITRRKGG